MKEGSYDIIGSIAILPLYLENSKAIAKKLLSEHTNIKTVLQKESKIKGRLRKPGLKFLAGKKNFETIHHENKCLMKLDVRTCYFSPRLSSDRLEIAKQVKKNEKVLVLFSGIAPYALVIAKRLENLSFPAHRKTKGFSVNSKAKEVYAVELNRIATKYAQENIKLNKLKNVTAIQGDVKKIIPKLKQKIRFDRIIMARPQLKETFLSDTLKIAHKNTVIHFYDFLWEEEIPAKAIERIENEVKKAKKKIKIIGWKKAGEIGPRKWRVRVDFKIL